MVAQREREKKKEWERDGGGGTEAAGRTERTGKVGKRKKGRDGEKAAGWYNRERTRARRGRITGLSTVDVTVWRVAWEERGATQDEAGERTAGRATQAKGEPARVAAMGEKIDILIGQNNWNERTNGRS